MTKVHVEAKKFAAEGYTIVLVGHAGHEEVEGTMGEAPEHIVLIETEEDVDGLEVEDPDKVAYISQTTLSVDETRAIINRLRERSRASSGPRTDDICYATTNRQAAVKQLAAAVRPRAGHRLARTPRTPSASSRSRASYGTDGAPDRQRGPGAGGVARRASASSASRPARAPPRSSSQRLVEFFRDRGTEDVAELEVIQEDVRFMLPKTIRKALAEPRDPVAPPAR